MKYDRINREIKACLRIQDRGQLQGIINLVAGQTLSLVFIKRFLELLLHAGEFKFDHYTLLYFKIIT